MNISTNRGSSYELPEELTLSALEFVCEGDELLMQLYADLIDCLHRYYKVAVQHENSILNSEYGNFTESMKSGLESLDVVRRITHTSLCDQLRILARTMSQNNYDASWIQNVSGENEANNRESIGRWAIRQITQKNKQEGINNVPVNGTEVAGFTE